jgi:hypothetical protein
MPNANLGPAYDIGRRLSSLEAQVRALSTQPVLLNASTGQDGGVGVSTDTNGLHLFDPTGLEVLRLDTSLGAMRLLGTVGEIQLLSGSTIGRTVPLLNFVTTDGGGVQTLGGEIYQSYNELVMFGPTTTTNASACGRLGLKDSATTLLAYAANGGASSGIYLNANNTLQLFAGTTTTGASLNFNADGSFMLAAPIGGPQVYSNANNTWFIGGSKACVYTSAVAGPVLVAGGLTVSGTKNFSMHHPTKPGWTLKHASTESPHNGIEYWGEAVFDSAGAAVVALPDYFSALAKPDGRAVLLTQQGRPTVPTGYDPIVGNTFNAYGTPGATFSWSVKAIRQSLATDEQIEFDVESEGITTPPSPPPMPVVPEQGPDPTMANPAPSIDTTTQP